MEREGMAHLASLARLQLPEEELLSLGRDMESIIALMDSLREVDMGDGAGEEGGVALGLLREDAVLRRIDPALFLEQAPGGARAGFEIPRMME